LEKVDRISGMILFCFGVFVGLKSFHYPLGSLRSPGPGLLPLSASLLMIAFSGFMVVHSFLRKGGTEKTEGSFFSSKETPQRVILGFLSLVGFRYIFPLVGFAPAAFLFVFFLVKFLGHYSWRVSIIFSALTALFSYFLFQVWLNIQMPKGLVGL
jgi:hypothetical protein